MQASCCDHGFSPSSFSAQVAVSPVRGFTMTTFAAQPLSKKAAVIIASIASTTSSSLGRLASRSRRRGTVPPAAAERLEQRRRVGQPIRLCLDTSDQRLLIGLPRAEQGQVAGGSELLLPERDIEGPLRGPFGGDRRSQAFGVSLEGIQPLRHA